MMEVRTTCPLGSECEKAVDGHIERCAWYVKMRGNNPQSGEPIDDSRCAMQWLPLLAVESNGKAIDIARSVQSLRNETVSQQAKAIEVIKSVQISSDS